MKVLIGGGATYLGAQLGEALLRAGHSIVAYDRDGECEHLTYLNERAGFELLCGDPMDADLLNALVADADAVASVAPPGGGSGAMIQSTALMVALAQHHDRHLVVCGPPAPPTTSRTDHLSVLVQAARRDRGFAVTLARIYPAAGHGGSCAGGSALTTLIGASLNGGGTVVTPDLAAFAHIEDVTTPLVRLIEDRRTAGFTLELGSDEALTAEQLHVLVASRLNGRANPDVTTVPSTNGLNLVADLTRLRALTGYERRWSTVSLIDALVSEHGAGPIVSTPPTPVDEFAGASVTVIVPVYNEAPSIAETVRRIKGQPLEHQLVIVDDGSTDDTVHELNSVRDLIDDLIVLPSNRGKGSAMRAGLEHARGDIVVFQDADRELEPDDVPRLVRPILAGTADAVYGDRLHHGNRPFVPRKQLLGNSCVNGVARMLYGVPLNDISTAAKAFPRELLLQMDLRSKRFEIECEMVAKAALLGARFAQLPIIFRPRSRAEGKKLKSRDGLSAAWALVRHVTFRPGRARAQARRMSPTPTTPAAPAAPAPSERPAPAVARPVEPERIERATTPPVPVPRRAAAQAQASRRRGRPVDRSKAPPLPPLPSWWTEAPKIDAVEVV